MSAVPSSSHVADHQPGKRLTWIKNVNRWIGKAPVPLLLPEGERVYAVGDVHGRSDLLDALFVEISKDAKCGPTHKTLIFLGDYIDRGPDSKGVVERLLSHPGGFQTHFIRGNHDQAFLDFITDPMTYLSWKQFGAKETLWSYGVRPPKFDQRKFLFETRDELLASLPGGHLDFFQKLQPYMEIGRYYFTHAGVRPGVALNVQRDEDLMWIRDDFLASTVDFGKIVIHGHSVGLHPICRTNRIGIDTGAYATGKLTAAVLEGSDIRFLHT